MADKQFKWGVIGPGRIAQQFANGLKVIEGAESLANMELMDKIRAEIRLNYPFEE